MGSNTCVTHVTVLLNRSEGNTQKRIEDESRAVQHFIWNWGVRTRALSKMTRVTISWKSRALIIVLEGTLFELELKGTQKETTQTRESPCKIAVLIV